MNAKKLLVVIFIATLMCATAFLCSREEADVPDNGGGADEVRTELDGAIQSQQESIQDLRDAEIAAEDLRGEITDSRKEIGTAYESAKELGVQNDRAGEIIADCQSILRGVRQRGAR